MNVGGDGQRHDSGYGVWAEAPAMLVTSEREFTVEVVGMEIWKLGLLDVVPAPFDPFEAPLVTD
jgi:hypothetical protein